VQWNETDDNFDNKTLFELRKASYEIYTRKNLSFQPYNSLKNMNVDFHNSSCNEIFLVTYYPVNTTELNLSAIKGGYSLNVTYIYDIPGRTDTLHYIYYAIIGKNIAPEAHAYCYRFTYINVTRQT